MKGIRIGIEDIDRSEDYVLSKMYSSKIKCSDDYLRGFISGVGSLASRLELVLYERSLKDRKKID